MNDIKGIIEDAEKSDLVSDKVIKKVIEIIGQEKWQDINDEKSDICTTTGELIITLKRIPDLEKENKTLEGCLLAEQEHTQMLEQQIEKMKCCHNCRHFAEPYKLCCYSLGDEDYDCRGRKWEIKENV